MKIHNLVFVVCCMTLFTGCTSEALDEREEESTTLEQINMEQDRIEEQNIKSTYTAVDLKALNIIQERLTKETTQ